MYRAKGPEEAIAAFTSAIEQAHDGPVLRDGLDSKRSDEIRANVMFWFEFELRHYTSAEVNLGLLEAGKEKFVHMAGIESGGMRVVAITKIARKLGKEVVRVPGAHIGYQTDTEEFIKALLKLLT
jgi:hypothetical protein